MRLLFALALSFAALLAVGLAAGPAFAHDENAHGESAADAAPRDTGAPSSALSGKRGHDGASGSPDGAPGRHDDAEATGFVPLLKHLHPATVHFPIALFLTAAFVEFAAAVGMAGRTGPAVRVLIYAGAIGAFVAALFGWIHTGLWLGGEETMQFHRWMGTLIAVLGIGLAFLARRDAGGRRALRTGLATIAVLIVAQGYLGGELAHGPDHLGLSLT